MKKKPHKQNVYTAITFQGVSVKVLQITARTQKEAEKKLLSVHGCLGEDKALAIDEIMEHEQGWSFAVFDAKKIRCT